MTWFKHPDPRCCMCLSFFLSLDCIPRSRTVVIGCEHQISVLRPIGIPLFLMCICLAQNCCSGFSLLNSRPRVTFLPVFHQFFPLLWHHHKMAFPRVPWLFQAGQGYLLLSFVSVISNTAHSLGCAEDLHFKQWPWLFLGALPRSCPPSNVTQLGCFTVENCCG